MDELIVYVDGQNGLDWLYPDEWKMYCGVDDFEETFVIKGNRDYHEIAEASWYVKAKDIIADLDCNYNYDEWSMIYADELTLEQREKINNLYNTCRYTDEIMLDVIRVLYPEDKFEVRTIRGYCQGEWQEVLYKANEEIDMDYFESLYFGKLTDIYSDDGGTFVTNDEIWKWEREDKMESEIRNMLDIPKETPIKIMVADGIITTTKWKELK